MQNTRKPRVLIVNDDGYKSSNIRALATALSAVSDVYVFAPETEQSGVSQAFTVRKMLNIVPVPAEKADDGAEKPWPFEFYSVSGTPADCAKFALGHFARYGMNPELPENKRADRAADFFDVCFSGVNVGENSGVSSLYSGTVAGAREACLWGVHGIALSLRGVGSDMLDTAIQFAVKVVSSGLFKNIQDGVFWNVNFPKTAPDQFKGYKATIMARGMFTDHYDHKVEDGKSLWQLDGDKLWNEAPVDSDDYLLNQGYAAITPHRIDQTDYESLKLINEVIKEGKVNV